MAAYCRARGTRELVGTTLANNMTMLRLARACGIQLLRSDQPAEDGVELRLLLTDSNGGNAPGPPGRSFRLIRRKELNRVRRSLPDLQIARHCLGRHQIHLAQAH